MSLELINRGQLVVNLIVHFSKTSRLHPSIPKGQKIQPERENSNLFTGFLMKSFDINSKLINSGEKKISRVINEAKQRSHVNTSTNELYIFLKHKISK